MRPGTVYVYSTRAGERGDVDTMTVAHEEKRILGIPAVVVRDRTYHHGVLTEDSADWYAQDRDGNVWYLGEDTKEYKDGKVVSTAGSWEAGKNGAEPGIITRTFRYASAMRVRTVTSLSPWARYFSHISIAR